MLAIDHHPPLSRCKTVVRLHLIHYLLSSSLSVLYHPLFLLYPQDQLPKLRARCAPTHFSLISSTLRCTHLNHIYNSLKTKRFIHGQLAQNLPIQSNPTLGLHIDKIRVRNIMLTNSSIQPLNPELSEFAFLDLTVTVGILPWFFEAADGDTVAAVCSTAEPLGLFDDSFVLDEIVHVRCTLSWHIHWIWWQVDV